MTTKQVAAINTKRAPSEDSDDSQLFMSNTYEKLNLEFPHLTTEAKTFLLLALTPTFAK